MMSTRSIGLELIASNIHDATSIQMDEEHQALFVLTNDRLTRIDLNKKEKQVEFVHQHNRRFGANEMQMNEDDDDEEEIEEYSQGESDEDPVNREIVDPFDDSEPSTDDDEEKISNRRNWRRYGWRIYRLDNPCSILFLSEWNQLIVLNEGVITFLQIHMEDNRPFVHSPSKNIFCYDYEVFEKNGRRISVQPWSITSTSIKDYFIFSLLDSHQLYSLDMRNETIEIEAFLSSEISSCPYLLFHHPSNQIFVYDSTQLFALSLNDRTISQIEISFLPSGQSLSTMTIDQTGTIYLLSGSIIYKCTYQSKLELIESLGSMDKAMSHPQMIVTKSGKDFFLSDMDTASVYRCNPTTT